MKLGEWMNLKGLKDADVSRLLDGRLSRSQINRIRTAISNPSIENARALEELTSIPAGDFVLGLAGMPQTRAPAEPQASAA